MPVFNGDFKANFIDGSNFDDTINGFEENDTLNGLDGDDELYGGADDDELYGGDDNDTLDGGSGNDGLNGGAGDDVFIQGNDGGSSTIIGGTGTDLLDLSLTAVGWGIDLSAGTGTSGGTALSISGIERVNFGSGNDQARGGPDSGTTYSLYGGGGNDTLYFSAGRDLLFGGTDDDTFIVDDPTNISAFDNIFSGSGNDRLLIQTQADGDFFDMFSVDVTSIAEIEFAAVGSDMDVRLRLSGNEHTSTGAEYANNLLVDGNNVTGSTEIIQIDMSSDTMLDLSGWTFIGWGGQGERVEINGDADAETITGTTMDDDIDGAGGDDLIAYVGGADTLDGGLGTDTLEASALAMDLVIDLTAGTGSYNGDALVVAGFERVNFGSGNDQARGGPDSGTTYSLYGGGGNDTLYFSAGRDLLFGGTDDDTFIVDDPTNISAFDNIFSGSGNDRLLIQTQADGDFFDMFSVDVTSIAEIEFAAVGSDMDVRLRLSGNEHTSTGAEYANNLLVDGNNVTGSTEIIQIDMSSDTMLDLSGWTFIGWGGQGERVEINGDADAETITGTSMVDRIEGGAGADTLDGGGGSQDILSYAGSASAVTINLATNSFTGGDATGDVISGFEIFEGSGNADQLLGNGSGNTLFGLGGDDTLDGMAGDDLLDGGDDIDTVTFINSGSGIDLKLDGSNDAVATGFGNDTVRNVENIIGSGMDDTLMGDAVDNMIEGGDGDDVLGGGGGTSNTVSYAGATSGVNVSLSTTAAQKTGGAGTDTITNFQNILGSGNGDQLEGDGNTNILTGGGGNDTLVGDGGADTLFGGSGSDDLFGGSQGDTLFGGGDADDIRGGSGSDTLEGGDGNDTLDGGSGTDTAIFSGAFADYDVTGSYLTGFSFSDMVGSDGVDELDDVEFAQFSDQTVDLMGLNNAPPVVTIADQNVAGGVWTLLSTVMSVTDAETDPITQYWLWDDEGGNNWWADGGYVDANAGYITSNLSDIWFQGDSVDSSQTLWVRVRDGYNWSAWDQFQLVTSVNAPPVVSVPDQTVDKSEWTLLSDVMSITDPDGDTMTSYEIYDNQGGNSWWADGGYVDASTGYTTSNLSDIWFRGDAVAGSQTLWVRANDGTEWSGWDDFLLITEGNTAPTATVDDQTVDILEWTLLSGVLNVTDPDGDTMVNYEIYDNQGATAGGRMADMWMPRPDTRRPTFRISGSVGTAPRATRRSGSGSMTERIGATGTVSY